MMVSAAQVQKLGLHRGQTRNFSRLLVKNAQVYNIAGERVFDGDLDYKDAEKLARILESGEVLVVLHQSDVCQNMAMQAGEIEGATGDMDRPGLPYIMQYGFMAITWCGVMGIVDDGDKRDKVQVRNYWLYPIRRWQVSDFIDWYFDLSYRIKEEIVEGGVLAEVLEDLVMEIRKERPLSSGWRVLIRTCRIGDETSIHHEILPAGITDKKGSMPYMARCNYNVTLDPEEEILVAEAVEKYADKLSRFEIV